MQNMPHSFHGIKKTTTAKPIHIKLINNKYGHKLKNNINLKKTLITHNINKCFEIIAEFNIIFTIFGKKI